MLGMAVKTLTITEDAYLRLASLKRPGESFSELIRRMTMRRPLADFVGAFDAAPPRALEGAIRSTRREFDASVRRTGKRLRG